MVRKSVSTFIFVLSLAGLGFAQEQKAGEIWLASSQRALKELSSSNGHYCSTSQAKNVRGVENWNARPSDSKVTATLKDSFVALKVDGAKESKLMQKMQVEGLPTVVIMAPDGKELTRVVGYVTPEEMQAALQKSISQGRIKPSSK